ncbi:BrnA antitoxin family protein [Jannaschia sp. LMIT008]|uniref:BrnA antitoxin family protein n=1 Tax=Jannaschia maritima TaxID=3032585 RepID=UPI0028126F34|nr:BrnA antitoxin family protein [Jannaschia sp. LMIT008]
MDQIRRKPGTRQREHREEYAALVAAFDADMVVHAAEQGEVPDEWEGIWRDRTKRTVKMTIRVDEDVAKFFQSMGPGYGPRMNRVLRAFVLSRLGGFLHGGAMPEKFRKDWMTWHHGGDGDIVMSRELVSEMNKVIELQGRLVTEMARKEERLRERLEASGIQPSAEGHERVNNLDHHQSENAG